MKQKLKDVDLGALFSGMRRIFFFNAVDHGIHISLALIQNNELTWSEKIYVKCNDFGQLPLFNSGILQICFDDNCIQQDISVLGSYHVRINNDGKITVRVKPK
jgi:hypothetical protein